MYNRVEVHVGKDGDTEAGEPRGGGPYDHQLLDTLLVRLGIGLIRTDPRGHVEYLSPLAEKLTGWGSTEARGHKIERVYQVTQQATERDLSSSSADGLEEAVLVSRAGQRYPIAQTIAPMRDEDGRIIALLIAFHDITRRKLADLQLTRQATHDGLTGLLNREAFAASVDGALKAMRGKGQPFAVCQIDLDQFNLVNNTCGHTAGDTLLQWVASLLREEVREADVLARLAGDVFGLVLGDAPVDEARRVVESVYDRLQHFQFTWADKTFSIGASIGLVPVESGDWSVNDVLRAADHACAMAKKGGRNQIHISTLEDEEITVRREDEEWVARIRKNLQEGGVTLFAQPILPLSHDEGGQLHFEVLLRMTGDDGLLRSAGRVIRATERYGLMASIDRWVVRHTLEALRAQPREVLDRVQLCSINLSGGSLHDRTLLEYVQQQLAAARIPPRLLCFEITETAAVDNLEQARWFIGELSAIGCRFALDDFGSGLASYGYIKDLPVDFLKISGEFVENMASSPLDRALVESINQIGKVLGIATVAEAVSSQAALEAVLTIGVDYAQGNWVGPPRPLAEVLAPQGQ